jgi:hypothetical protein
MKAWRDNTEPDPWLKQKTRMSLRRASPQFVERNEQQASGGAKNESESSSLDSQSSTLVAVRSDSTFWTQTAKKRKPIDIYETASRKNFIQRVFRFKQRTTCR